MTFIKPKRTVRRVFLHCSASDVPEHDDVTVIDRWHKGRGWHSVGYHYFIQSNGNIQTGRSLERRPAAQKGHNKATIAICCHGLIHFTKAQRKSLLDLCRQINEAYDGQVTFHGHKEVNKYKTCPVYDYQGWLNLDENGYMKRTGFNGIVHWLRDLFNRISNRKGV